MEHSPLISIIVPVYNVERFLPQCLDSLIHQTVKHFEVVIVNDGSTDKSLEICKGYASQLQKCQIINQTNQGVSVARNFGIEYSSGTYLYFMDSDDFIDKNFIETLTNEIKEDQHDIFIFGYSKININGIPISRIVPKCKQLIIRDRNFENLFDHLIDGFGLAVWDKLIKASLVRDNHIKFKKMKNAEDFVFSIDLYSKARSIKTLDFELYKYRIQTFGKRNDNYDLPKNHIIAMEKLIQLVYNYNSDSANKFISKIAALWFGIVNPLNIASLVKVDFKAKIELINMTYQWKELNYLKSRVGKKYLKGFEKLSWIIFLLNNSLITLSFGILLSKVRKIKYN